MPLLLLLLGLGVGLYFVVRARRSGLGRNCRWRQARSRGVWTCAYCGATTEEAAQPLHCALRR